MTADFQYDVFISYCGEDREMVKKRFVDPLKKEKMKVKWDLEFENGLLPIKIADAIEKSRKVLFILTSNLLNKDSGWIKYEQAISITQSTDEKIEDKIIPVYFGDRNQPCASKQAKLFKIYVPIYANGKSDDELIKEIVKRVWGEAVSAFQFSTGGCALAIGSHWDDILLGCLGTLIKLKETLGYHIDVVVLCDFYPTKYYGVYQHGLDKIVSDFYDSLCSKCGFRYLKIHGPSLTDRTFHQNAAHVEAKIQNLVDNYIEGNKSVRPYNIIFCPPIDDRNSDHAVTGEIVFDKFRIRNHTILEYVIKRYTESSFVPNLCISLDDDISRTDKWFKNLSPTEIPDIAQKTMQEIITKGNVFRISDAKVSCIENTCEVTEKIKNSERLFSPEALRARMKMNALDYGKRFDVQYAEVFRGRLDL